MQGDDFTILPFRMSSNKKMRFLRYRQFYLERDILRIAYTIFNIERKLKSQEKISKVKIPVSLTNIDYGALSEEIEDLLRTVLSVDVSIKFVHSDTTIYKRAKNFEFEKCDSVCLFSGGVDSFSGLLASQNKFPDVRGLFVAHSDQQRIINIVHRLDKVLKREDLMYNTVYAPPIRKLGYAQLRGFLYILSSSVYAHLLQSKNILITECGPTMYQPMFSPFDSVTKTTHPFVLEKAKRVLDILLNRKINLIIPFENMTKAEVASVCPEKEYLKHTHSCVSQRFGVHDGTCFGCIIRRLGLATAGIEDVNYSRNPLVDSSANADGLLSLLRFCYDVLFDYEKLPSFSKENIENYGKYDLFRRFSLDNFSALLLHKEKTGKQNSLIKNIYDDGLKIIGKDELIKRAQTVRKNKIKPNFKRYVK